MTRAAHIFLAAALVFLAGCSTDDLPTASSRPAAPPPTSPSASAEPAAAGPERIVARPAQVRPAQPAMAASFRADLLADHCVDRDVPSPPVVDASLVLLDRTYAISPGAVPSDLVAASAAGLSGGSGTKLVRAALIEDLAAMAAAWRQAGLAVIIESAYRSYANQSATFNSWVTRLGYGAALARSARPGHSEHQLGTALDLTSPGWGGRFGDWAVESAEGAWMAAHGWEYGFVMSYPAASQEWTCFSYEPWHYRWIGRAAAAAQRASGLPLRQFLERYVGG